MPLCDTVVAGSRATTCASLTATLFVPVTWPRIAPTVVCANALGNAKRLAAARIVKMRRALTADRCIVKPLEGKWRVRQRHHLREAREAHTAESAYCSQPPVNPAR